MWSALRRREEGTSHLLAAATGCGLRGTSLEASRRRRGGDADPAWATAGGLAASSARGPARRQVPRARARAGPAAAHTCGPHARDTFGVCFHDNALSLVITRAVCYCASRALQPRFLLSRWAETRALNYSSCERFLLQVLFANRQFLDL